MKKILHQAYLTGYKRRKDKSVSLSFVTQEVSSEEITTIDELQDSFGYVYFREGDTMRSEEVETLDAIDLDLEDKSKSPSKRLRNVLYKYWEQHQKEIGFKDFYKSKMEVIIQHYKDQLE
jgi:hypothetical protein